MHAEDVMSAPVYVAEADETTAHARNLMLKHKISRLLVMEKGRLTGIVTKKDIGYRLRQTEPIWRRRPIDRIPLRILMTPDPVTVQPETGMKEIAALMVDRGISGLPVVTGAKIEGIVTKSDILRSSLVNALVLPVHDLMEDAVTVSRYHSLDHVIEVMSERNDKVVVVNNDGSLAGIITESNLAFFRYQDSPAGVPSRDITMLRRDASAGRKTFRYVMDISAVAEDVMSRPVITIPTTSDLHEAVLLMREHHVNSLVITDGSEVRGIIKRDDIIKEVAK